LQDAQAALWSWQTSNQRFGPSLGLGHIICEDGTSQIWVNNILSFRIPSTQSLGPPRDGTGVSRFLSSPQIDVSIHTRHTTGIRGPCQLILTKDEKPSKTISSSYTPQTQVFTNAKFLIHTRRGYVTVVLTVYLRQQYKQYQVTRKHRERSAKEDKVPKADNPNRDFRDVVRTLPCARRV
jgi:hypothetical protein